MRLIRLQYRGDARESGIEESLFLTGAAQHEAADVVQTCLRGVEIVSARPKLTTAEHIEIKGPVIIGPLQALRNPDLVTATRAVNDFRHPAAQVVLEPRIGTHPIVAKVIAIERAKLQRQARDQHDRGPSSGPTSPPPEFLDCNGRQHRRDGQHDQRAIDAVAFGDHDRRQRGYRQQQQHQSARTAARHQGCEDAAGNQEQHRQEKHAGVARAIQQSRVAGKEQERGIEIVPVNRAAFRDAGRRRQLTRALCRVERLGIVQRIHADLLCILAGMREMPRRERDRQDHEAGDRRDVDLRVSPARHRQPHARDRHTGRRGDRRAKIGVEAQSQQRRRHEHTAGANVGAIARQHRPPGQDAGDDVEMIGAEAAVNEMRRRQQQDQCRKQAERGAKHPLRDQAGQPHA